jgi:putative transcriptional regulator
MNNLKAGSILVAHPDLNDPDFGRSVILILNHDEGGTLGVNVAVAPVKGSICASGPLPLPGPICLRKAEPGSDDSKPVGDSGYAVGPVRSRADLEAVPDGGMVLVGYAGWGQGQLSDEMGMGAWFPTTTSLEAILKAAPADRWKLAADGAGVVATE